MGNNNEDKLRALDAALGQIEKQYGKGAVMKLGDSAANMNVETIPTGSLSLDIALGLGGVPKGRIIEVYGPESSGKTTVALHMVAEVQKRGGIAGFIDAEHALDPAYAKNIGVDIENLYISQPDNGEQALNMLAASPDIGMFISDLMLPGSLSGAEVINQVRSQYPQLPVLLISGQDLRPTHNPQLPDVQLLRKPFTRVQLAQALRKVMVI